MEALYALESIRVPWLDTVMAAITHLGEETVFMVAALFVFWCVSKRHGYYLLAIGFAGTVLNQFLKLLFRIPRPWVLDSDFTIVESARAQATGYSFPSGHSQNAIGTFGGIARFTRRKWVRVAAIVVAVLVPLSRMYLGVHTPLARLAASTSAGKGYSDTNSRYPTASASITASTAPMTPCRLSLRSIRGYRANTSATAITAATPTSSGV